MKIPIGFKRKKERRRAADLVLQKIDSVRRSIIAWTVGWGYLWAVLLAAVMIAAGVLLDHWVVLQRWGRLAFFRGFVSLSGGALVFATLYPLFRRASRLYIARRMEVRHPELKNALISYLESRSDPHTPRELKRLMRQRVSGPIQSLDAKVVVEPSRYVRLAAVLASVLVAFVLYTAISPKSAIASVRRLLRPEADIQPPTATRLSRIEPGDLYVVKGHEARLAVAVAGRRPEGVSALWDGVSFSDRRVLLVEKGQGRWEGAFPPILEDGGYHLVAGDTRSERFVIKVLPNPAVTQVRLMLTPPPYTGLPVQTITGGNVDLVYGTQVDLTAVTNLPPRAGHVEFQSGRRLPLSPTSDGAALEGRFTAIRSDSYLVHFESLQYPNGATFRNQSPIRFRITCRQDRAPEIELLDPPDGLEADRNETVALSYRARDDFGLAAIHLHYRINELAGPTVDLGEPGTRRVERGAYAWRLADLPIRPGVVLTYCLEATDNLPEAPNTARTEERHIVIRQEGPAEPLPQAPDLPEGERDVPLSRPDVEQTSPREAGEERDAGEPGGEGSEPGATADAEAAEPSQASQAPEALREGEDPAQQASDTRLAEQMRRIAEVLERYRGRGEFGREGAESTGQGPQVPPEARMGEADPSRSRVAESDPLEGAVPGPRDSDAPAGREADEEAGLPSSSGESGQGENVASAEDGGAGARSGSAAKDAEAGPRAETERRPTEGGPRSESPDRSEGPSSSQGDGAAMGGEKPEQPMPPGARPPHGSGSKAGEGGAKAGAAGQDGEPGATGSAGGQAGGKATSEGSGAGRGAPVAGRQSAPMSARPGQGTGVHQLPEAGPREGAPAGGPLAETADQIDSLLTNEHLPPGLLKDLGMDKRQLRDIIDRFRAMRRPEGEDQPASDEGEVEAEPPATGRIVESPESARQGLRAADGLPDEVVRDVLRSRFEGSSERLAPRYRDVVTQYYRTLAEEQ